MKTTTGRLKRLGMTVPLIAALLGTPAFSQEQDQPQAQVAESQRLQTMDELESFLQIQDDDKNTLTYRQYVFTLKKELLGDDYVVRSPDLTEDLLIAVNEQILNGQADDVTIYGIGQIDTREEFFRSFSVRYGTPEAESLIREIQNMAGMQETGEIGSSENIFEFYKTAHTLYEMEQTDEAGLATSLAVERQENRQLREQNDSLEQRLQDQQEEYQEELTMYRLITLSSGQNPVPESYIESMTSLQDDLEDGGEGAQEAQSQIAELNTALYNRVIETYLSTTQEHLESNDYQAAAQSLAQAKTGYEAVRDVQLDLNMYDEANLNRLDNQIETLTDTVATYLDTESINTPDEIASDMAQRSYQLQQEIIQLRELERDARPNDWQEQIADYNELQESIYRGLIGFHIDEARTNREQGEFNRALENLAQAEQNYQLIVNTQKGVENSFDTVDRDLFSWEDMINNHERLTELAQMKADDTLQDDQFILSIMPFLRHSSVINSYSMDDGAGNTLVDVTAKDTDYQSGIELSGEYNHRTDNFITGIRNIVLAGGVGTHLLSGTDNLTDENFGSSNLFNGGLSENGYLFINGQLYPYAGARLVERENGDYLLDIFGMIGGGIDYRSGTTDDVPYTNVEWNLGAGTGVEAHWINSPTFSLDSWLEATYTMTNFQDTAHKAHEIEARLGSGLLNRGSELSQLLEVEGVYQFNITRDNQTYHTVAVEGRLGTPTVHVRGGAEVLNTQETRYDAPFNGSITPGVAWYGGIEFTFDLGRNQE